MIDKPTPTPKRQRQFEDPPRPSSKKQATNVGPQSDQRELYRAEITRVYKSYNVLLDPPSQEQALVAFQGLLTAAQGSCGARRLAARLVPKFLDRFPSLLDASATCLLGLVCSPPAADHRSAVKAAFAAAAAADALQGLVTLCKAALTAADGEAVVTRVVFFLLRRCGPAQPKNHSNGTRERDGGGREVDDASQVLLSAFTGACRVVLSALLKALQDGPEMQAGAEHFITKQLLGASQEPQGALGSKAHSNGSASPAQVSKIPGKTSRSGVCRAAQILSQHPDTHRLLLDAVKHAPKGSSTVRGKDGADVLQKLLQCLPALPAQQSAAPVLPALQPLQGLPHLAAAVSTPPPAFASLGSWPSPTGPALANGPSAPPRITEPSRLAESSLGPPITGDQVGGPAPNVGPGPPGDDAPAALPPPGGDICAASCCLWMGGLPPQVAEGRLRAECASCGPLQSVIYLAPDRQDQVYVTFTDIRDAAVCYERMSGEAIWGGRPLQVRFCEYEPGGTATARSGEQAQLHVWVGGVRSSSGEEEVMRTLAEARVMMPQNVLRVAGAKPGLVLQFASSRSVGPAVAALRLRVSKPASPPAKPPPPAPAMREPECRTLWVGQVGPEVDEEDILQAFRRYGNVVGHKFLRRSHCAFIDFDKPSAAAAAKNALVGARFGPCQIRLEFKDERRPGGGGPVGPSFRGAGDEPRRPYSPPGGPPHRDSFVGSFRDGYSRDAGPRGRAPLREDPLPGRPPHRVSHPPASQRTSPSGPPGIWGRSRERSPPSPGHWWGGPSPGRPSDTPSHRQSQWDTGSDQLPRSTGRTSKWGPATGTPSAESTPAGDTGSKWGPAVADSVLPPGMSSRLSGVIESSGRSPAGRDWKGESPPQPPPPLPAESAPPLPSALRPPLPPGPLSVAHLPADAPPDRGGSLGQAWSSVSASDLTLQTPPALPTVTGVGAGGAARVGSRLSAAGGVWQGKLAKSGVVVCSVLCKDPPEAGSPTSGPAAQEPLAWPPLLDVTMRANVAEVLHNALRVTPEGHRAVRRLVLATAGLGPAEHAEHRHKFVNFLNYLSSRSRAGVVKLGEAGGAGQRTMYLIPATQSVVDKLHVVWEPQELMVALIVPGHLK